MTDYGEMTRS